jgi:hypothetical protein
MVPSSIEPMVVAAPNATATGRDPSAAPAPPAARAPGLLLLALAAILVVAALSDGSGGVARESRLELAILAVSGFACAAWLFGTGLVPSAGRLGWTGVVALAAFAVWSAASVAWSVAPDRSWEHANRAIAAVLFLVLAIAVGSSLTRARERTGVALAVAAALVAAYSLLAGSVPGSESSLGLLMALAVLPGLAIAGDRGRGRPERLFGLAGVALLGFVLGLHHSPGAIIALAVGVGVLFALSGRATRLLVLALALVALVAVLAGVAGSDRGFRDAGDRNPFTSEQRVTLWDEALGAWSDRPLEGWGAGSFPVTHRLYRPRAFDARQPHSMPLQWLAETGAIGCALAIGGLLALIAAAVAAVPLRGGLAGAALVAVGAAGFVHSAFDAAWSTPGVALFVLLAGGVAVGRPAAVVAVPRSAAARGLGLAAALTALLVAAVLATLPALAASRTERAVGLAGADDADPAQLADAAAQAELAARLFPVAVEPLFATASIARRIGDLEQSRRQLFRAVERQPESSGAWARLVRIELLRGDRPSIERSARRMLALDPRDPKVLALAAQASAALQRPEGSATATGSPLPQRVPVAPPPLAPPP